MFTNEDPLICLPDGGPSTVQDVFLSRLMQTGATECATAYNFANQTEEHQEIITEKAKSILKNMATAVNNVWVLTDGLHTALLKKLPVDGKMRVLVVYDCLILGLFFQSSLCLFGYTACL